MTVLAVATTGAAIPDEGPETGVEAAAKRKTPDAGLPGVMTVGAASIVFALVRRKHVNAGSS